MKTFVKLLGLFCCLTVLYNSCSIHEYPPEEHYMLEIDGDLWWVKHQDIATLGGLVISGDWTTPGSGSFHFVQVHVAKSKIIFQDGKETRFTNCHQIDPAKKYTVTVWDHNDGTSTTTVRFFHENLTGVWYYEGDRLVLRDNNNEVYKKIELEYGGPVSKGGCVSAR